MEMVSPMHGVGAPDPAGQYALIGHGSVEVMLVDGQ